MIIQLLEKDDGEAAASAPAFAACLVLTTNPAPWSMFVCSSYIVEWWPLFGNNECMSPGLSSS